MAHPLFWPSKTFFYPIGNTAAISLTQDLAPEQSADILLLGCGDPRNILFTLYADVLLSTGHRTLDITCCDIEPAVLARNIILLTLLEDNEHIDRVWDIFYHFKIDDQALKLLVRQSKRLYDITTSVEAWHKSSYGSFLKFVDTRTLLEVRRHWKSYADFPSISSNRQANLRQEQSHLSKTVLTQFGANAGPSRSAGMLWPEAALPTINLFKRYWKTGTTFMLDTDVKKARNLNPMFVYSAPGEVFDPHYGTFPQGFHLAPAFAPVVSDATPSDHSTPEGAIINVMKRQFEAWGNAFRTSRTARAIVIRFYSGEALAFCRALDLFASTGRTATGISVSAWRASQINLDGLRTSTSPAPTSFDVIDTSNLTDHLGLLNLLLVARPLLKNNPISQAVLYTETLLAVGEDATKSFLDRICATVPTISTLLGIAPRAYVSGFSTLSNTHELLSPDKINQYHERVAWVDPSGGDHHANQQNLAVSFDAEDLAHVVFGLYDKMFASEQIMAALRAKPSLAKLKSMMVVNYHRETIAALLQLIKRRVYLHTGSWDDVAREFLGIIEDDRSRLVGMNNYQDLCLQLHLYGVHTVPPLEPDWQARFGARTPAKIFKNWTSVPPVLCVVLTVPRKSLQVLLLDTANTGTPTLHCILTAQGIHSNTYLAIHTVWGSRIITPNSNDVTLKEDEKGINGTSGLVVWFWASSRILEFEDTSVNLAIKSTPQSTLMFAGKLGMALTIFSAKLDDKKHVRLLTYCPPLANEEPWTNQTAIIRFTDPPPNRNIRKIMAGVSRGPRSRDVISLTARIPLRSADKGKGLLVSVAQTLPCTVNLSIGDRHQQSVAFPYPVLGTRYKMQSVKESNSVEITVPVSEPLDSGGYYLNRAPILRNNKAYSPWNLHHIYADRMPLLNLEDSSQLDWLGLHAVLQLSDPEKPIQSGPTAILADVKDSIFTLLLLCAGIRVRRSRYIGLCEPENGGIYAILLVGGLRLDLAAFTVVIDTALVPLSTERMHALIPGIQALQSTSSVTQIATRGEVATAWRKLLPAYVERCRTWSHKTDCEYTIRGKIPLSVEMKENPICTCGEGIGFEGPEWKVPLWDGLLPYATRAAISPLFLVSYMGIPIAGHLSTPGWNFKRICIIICVVLLVYRFWAR